MFNHIVYIFYYPLFKILTKRGSNKRTLLFSMLESVVDCYDFFTRHTYSPLMVEYWFWK